MSAPIFISYSSADQRIAQTICDALETRGFQCWIACRNVGAGENFQEAIVKAIRSAKLMILVFTSNANNSDEIKKEVVLAGRNHITVVPVRVEDVAPNDALAYEFATRQWVDLFKDWERHMEQLASQIGQILAAAASPDAGVRVETQASRARAAQKWRNPLLAGTAIVATLVVAGVGYLSIRPAAEPPAPGVPPASAAAPSPPAAPNISADERAWLEAENVGTVAALRRYLERFADGAHAAEAQTMIRTADDKAWSEAERDDTVAKLAQYVEQFPDGAHVTPARRRIADLEPASRAASAAPPAHSQDLRRFDGQWNVTQVCPKTSVALGFRFDFIADVKDGHLHGQQGAEGAAGTLTLDGQVRPDGTSNIFAKGYTGATAYSQGKGPRGTYYQYEFAPRFEGSRGSASVALPSGRPCEFTFARK